MDAVNTRQVFDWLWTSGQLSEQDVLGLPELGIQVVINLALPSSPNALAGEAELVTRLGLAYVQIPVVWEQPVVEQYFQFAGVLRAFSGRRVWVHCAMNMRVSAFIYLYRRLELGESEDEASFPMREIWEPDEAWQRFLQAVSQAAAGERKQGYAGNH